MAQALCGRCKRRVHMTSRWGHSVFSSSDAGNGQYIEGAFTCDNCGRLSIGTAPASMTFSPPDASQADRILSQDVGTHWLPRASEGRDFPDVPQHIAETATEATECFSIGAYRAAVLLARTVLEASAKAKGVTSGPLVAKITQMRDANFIRPDIADAAHEIRLGGNDVAHGDVVESLTPEEADEVLELMSEVLAEVFQGPARLAARKAKREAAKG